MEDYTEDMFVDEFTLSDTDKLPLEEIFLMNSGYYPAGAENDPNAPYNQPIDRDIEVEVNVEIGTFITITLPQYSESGHLVVDEDELKGAVEQAVRDKLNIDDEDIVLNNVFINSYK